MKFYDADLLTLFITSKQDFKNGKGVIKPRPFIPPDGRRLSVFRGTGLAENAIWGIGAEYVTIPPDRNVHARADFKARHVTAIGLGLDYSDSPPSHVDVVGWPSGKDALIELAQQLASGATLVLKPS